MVYWNEVSERFGNLDEGTGARTNPKLLVCNVHWTAGTCPLTGSATLSIEKRLNEAKLVNSEVTVVS
jgi:metal-sulfur cluster biosynthetic enzyme